MTDLIVMRLVDMHRVHPGQITAHCAKCGHEVGVYPSGQRVMKEMPDVRLICQICKEGGYGIELLAPGALVEALESKDKGS